MNDKISSLKVLVSCYACGPNWGSEVGMGWNWVTNLSQYCQLDVITENGFQQSIEETLPQLSLKYIPRFHYVDIGEQARSLFWKQGSYKFYSFYKKWQEEAYLKALKIRETEQIDLVHQLNMTGFREPGYLWKLTDISFVWGPVAGFGQIPWSYILQMNLYNKLFWGAKHMLNAIQMNYLRRVKYCVKRADLIVASTKETQHYIKELYGRKSVVINDSGTFNEIENVDYAKKSNGLNLIWVGAINSRKALDIAIKSVAMVKTNKDWVLHVCGNGPEEFTCKKMVEKLGLAKKVKFYGRLTHAQVIQLMKQADVLLFTSLMEGTPNVVNEALSLGLPVICHDICGQGEVVDRTCGLKIPLINHEKSILLFAKAIDRLTFASIQQMSGMALERARQITWKKKAEAMYRNYQMVYQNHQGREDRLS